MSCPRAELSGGGGANCAGRVLEDGPLGVTSTSREYGRQLGVVSGDGTLLWIHVY